MSNPFEQPAPEGEAPMYFGRLTVQTHKVRWGKGATFILPGLTKKDGNPIEFYNWILDENGDRTHVVLVLQTKARDGHEYKLVTDFSYYGGDVYYQEVWPSLVEHFGPKLEGIWNKGAWVKMERFTVRDYKKWAFRVAGVFENRQACEAAEVIHFNQYNQTPQEIANDIPGFDDEPEETNGMEKETAVKMLSTLFDASGKDYSAFVDLVKRTPVIFSAFGNDIDAPEIQKYDEDSIPY